MARIIKNGEILTDPWCLLAAGAEALGTVTAWIDNHVFGESNV